MPVPGFSLSPGLSGFNEIDHERDFQNLNRPGNKPVFQIWKAGANIYVVWTERGDGAVLVIRIWVEASSRGAGGDDTTCSSKKQKSQCCQSSRVERARASGRGQSAE